MSTDKEYDDDTIMPFGNYSGKKLGDIPDKYFEQLEYMNSGETSYRLKYPELFTYIEDNIL